METKKHMLCPITAEITYRSGKHPGTPMIRVGDRFVHDNDISKMVFNLKQMGLNAMKVMIPVQGQQEKICNVYEYKIYDNRKPFYERLIFWYIDGRTEINDLASYLDSKFNPPALGEESETTRKQIFKTN